jgi:mannose-6-phosphate isomerase-like protein (cupin superfamily)
MMRERRKDGATMGAAMDEKLAQPAAAPFATRQLGPVHDVLAPDTSEIRLLVNTSQGSMAHGTLPPGGVSLAISHSTVEEVWYVTEGRGQVWRKHDGHEEVVDVGPGTALTIPVGAHFQFRTVGDEPLRFVMWTMPPWPGAHEAVRVPDYWPGDAADGE